MSDRISNKGVLVAAAGVVIVVAAIIAGLYYDSTRQDEAADGAQPAYTPPAGAGGPSAVFIGDSYTSGAGASELTERWTSLLASTNFWNETNLGIGSTGYITAGNDCGATRCENFGTVATEAVQLDPRIVVVSGGNNDFEAFVNDPTPVVDAIYRTFGTLRAGLPDARILAVGPSSAGEVPPFVTAFDNVVRDAATAVGGQFISLVDPIDVITEDMLSPDGLHVDDEGHAAIARHVSEALK
ncbi:SGNH/GDSL hydrolase family protein [Rhodococcoides fascians]|uniref:SGNH/GDSL hydrolase family protein n=1 Tax=Rhodococcoides fascians TaxID=1828 RepID=UPI00056794C2|nr:MULTISPECIES: SGNH/GDSL hydrolase family protein [Rhodococcus]OZF04151.1 hypothetical protein CH301_06640 [Rhodococcus sp. 15-1189-1-1a]OZF18828.1 hypothetical protein CH299_07185 [Rhodococcus sp. 14-2686-1-2]